MASPKPQICPRHPACCPPLPPCRAPTLHSTLDFFESHHRVQLGASLATHLCYPLCLSNIFHPPLHPHPPPPTVTPPTDSSDFFDGHHYVQLGASWATHPALSSRHSFRNWYQSGYGFGMAKFRLVAAAQPQA